MKRLVRNTKLNPLLILMYAESVTVPSAATYQYTGGNEDRTKAHEFMSKNIEDAVYEEDDLKDVFEVVTHPKHSGKTHILQKKEKYDAKITEYKEGAVIPMDAPQTVVETRVALKSYAGWGKMTEDAEIYDISNGKLEEKSSEQGHSLGEKIVSMKYRALLASTNRWYAGATVTSSDTHSALLEKVSPFNIDDFRKIRAFFRRLNVKPFKGNKYLVYITPEITSELFDLSKNSSSFTFVELANENNSERVFEGKIGDWLGFTFVETNAITDTEKEGVVGCVVLGKYNNKKGAVQVKLEGKNGIETIIKPRGTIGSDPLDTYGTYGWKYWVGYAIQHPEAVLIYYCKSSVLKANYPNVNDLAMETKMTGIRKTKVNEAGNGVELTEEDVKANESYNNGKGA